MCSKTGTLRSLDMNRFDRIAEAFEDIKNGLSFITSKSSSKNLRNENKHW